MDLGDEIGAPRAIVAGRIRLAGVMCNHVLITRWKKG